MATNLPYMGSYGHISFILDKIKQAKSPDRFTNDFLKTKIGAKNSNDRPFIGLAKRLGLLNSDGTPTELYKAFRSTSQKTSKAAMATAIRNGYGELYARNEYVHELNTKELEGLVIEITGLESNNRVVKNIVKTFEALKELADFEASPHDEKTEREAEQTDASKGQKDVIPPAELSLTYTIHLVLPKTDDIAVFNAIFKSLRENLLRK